ncbi:nicotinamide-nucleotide amidohydrolase family protein [Pigmentiphaga sp. GD03639]|nr:MULTISPECIES: nicotinamide-nucleotide amidohydrolase family protein [unclassified Pigmentiphaga]MDH2239938.1 nicotinamide-nucleotide amidohydrolase family protein [Pigmentiphaga sp. GD03639]OVZ62401.1 ompetence-damaged protein [Pigmentiphaga sp. NML030171]
MRTIEDIAREMRERKLLLATAESCTAGLIAAMLADVEGAGALLDCAFVVYSPDAKRHALGVPERILRTYNLTSEHVARAMGRGALARSRANVAIANTGVADGGGDGVAAGTQCYAWVFRGGEGKIAVYSETRRFPGGRNAVRERAARHALERLPYYADLAART